MADLSHLLGTKTGDVEKPKQFPVGHYQWVITGFEIVESSKKKTPGIEVHTKMVEPKDDVDEDELSLVKNPKERNQKMTLWITEETLWRIKEFLAALGLEDEDKTIEELLPEITGCTFVAPIKHETMEGSTDPIAKIDDNKITADE